MQIGMRQVPKKTIEKYCAEKYSIINDTRTSSEFPKVILVGLDETRKERAMNSQYGRISAFMSYFLTLNNLIIFEFLKTGEVSTNSMQPRPFISRTLNIIREKETKLYGISYEIYEFEKEVTSSKFGILKNINIFDNIYVILDKDSIPQVEKNLDKDLVAYISIEIKPRGNYPKITSA